MAWGQEGDEGHQGKWGEAEGCMPTLVAFSPQADGLYDEEGLHDPQAVAEEPIGESGSDDDEDGCHHLAASAIKEACHKVSGETAAKGYDGRQSVLHAQAAEGFKRHHQQGK